MLTHGKKIWGLQDTDGNWITDYHGNLYTFDDLNLAIAQKNSMCSRGQLCNVEVISEGNPGGGPAFPQTETKTDEHGHQVTKTDEIKPAYPEIGHTSQPNT